jgi:hypothetical protein
MLRVMARDVGLVTHGSWLRPAESFLRKKFDNYGRVETVTIKPAWRAHAVLEPVSASHTVHDDHERLFARRSGSARGTRKGCLCTNRARAWFCAAERLHSRNEKSRLCTNTFSPVQPANFSPVQTANFSPVQPANFSPVQPANFSPVQRRDWANKPAAVRCAEPPSFGVAIERIARFRTRLPAGRCPSRVRGRRTRKRGATGAPGRQ